MKVLKFGGSSIATAAQKNLVDIIICLQTAHNGVAVVFSALNGVTDSLIHISRKAENNNEKYKEEIEKDVADGRALGVTGTPGFIINGWGIKGAQPFSTFEEVIERELAK